LCIAPLAEQSALDEISMVWILGKERKHLMEEHELKQTYYIGMNSGIVHNLGLLFSSKSVDIA